MTRTIKVSLAAITLMTAAGLAMAQGTPPTTASPNPATGAGQQTQQNTPMGTTGTPAATQGTGTQGGALANTPSTPSTSSSGEPMRAARADRN